jgi:hypothetical protein
MHGLTGQAPDGHNLGKLWKHITARIVPRCPDIAWEAASPNRLPHARPANRDLANRRRDSSTGRLRGRREAAHAVACIRRIQDTSRQGRYYNQRVALPKSSGCASISTLPATLEHRHAPRRPQPANGCHHPPPRACRHDRPPHRARCPGRTRKASSAAVRVQLRPADPRRSGRRRTRPDPPGILRATLQARPARRPANPAHSHIAT